MFRHFAKLVSTMLLLGFASSISFAADNDPVVGTWKTEPGDTGGYLHVEITPCGEMMCGTIVKAFTKDNQNSADYEHLGKEMLSGMKMKAAGVYNKGKIWAPDKDKVYKSKMKVENGKLLVSGCVAFICRSQVWEKVN